MSKPKTFPCACRCTSGLEQVDASSETPPLTSTFPSGDQTPGLKNLMDMQGKHPPSAGWGIISFSHDPALEFWLLISQ